MSRSKKNWDFLVNYEGRYLNVLGQGLKGETGRKGEPGGKGTKGVKGRKGEDGPIGDKGDPGAKGARGFKGNKGTPSPLFVFQGSEPLISDLLLKIEDLTHVWHIEEDNGLYVWSGRPTIWVRLTGAEFVKGEQGVPGIDGIDGEKGIDGLTGDKGEPGMNGDKGSKGETGQDGNDGIIPLFTTFPELPTNHLP